MSDVSKDIVEARVSSIKTTQQQKIDDSSIPVVTQNQLVNTTTKAGSKANETVGGIKSLTQSADDTIDSITDSRPEQQTGQVDVVQVTNAMPGLKQKFGTQKQVRITASTQEAVAFNVKAATKATPAEIENVIRTTIVLDKDAFEKIERDFSEIINDVISPALNAANKVIDDVFTSLGNLINDISTGFGSLLENIVEQVTGNSLRVVNGIVVKNGVKVELTKEEFSRINGLIVNKDFRSAARELEKYSDLTLSEIENRLKAINNTLSANTNSDNEETLKAKSKKPEDYGKNWDDSKTKTSRVDPASNKPGHKFTLVTTHEELEVELKSIDREITEIITDWTETFTNQGIGAEELHQASQRNGQAIGYHYVIKRDGSLQRGRPVSEVGPGLKNNHHLYAVSVAFVGGISVPAGNYGKVEQYYSASSLTQAQMDTYKLFLDKSYDAWPGVQVLGMNDIDTSKVAPGFDVASLILSQFGKKNVFKNSFTQGPFTRAELIKQRVDNG